MPRIIDERGIIPARALNDIYLGLDHTNKLKVTLNAVGEAPTLYSRLTFGPNHTLDQFVCVSGVGRRVVRESLYNYETVSGSVIGSMFSRASQLREYTRQGFFDPSYWVQTGGYDLSALDAGAFAFSGGPLNPLGISWSSGTPYFDDVTGEHTHETGTGTTSYPGNYVTLDGHHQGVPEALFPGSHNQILDDAHFASLGLQGAECEGAGWFDDGPSNPSGDGWNYGPEGEGLFQQAPALMPSPVFIGFNYVGPGTSPYQIPFSETIIDLGNADAFLDCTGLGLEMPWFLQNCDQGTVINEAWMEIKTTDLVRTHWEFSQPTYEPDVETPYTYTGLLTNTEDISFTLMARSIDTATGYPSWTPAGTTIGADLVDGKWQFIDATPLFRGMLDIALSGGKRDIALMPSKLVSYVGDPDLRGFMRSLCPTIEWSYYSDPAWTESYKGGGDAVWMSANSGEFTSWTNLEVRNAVINFTLPSGVTRVEQYRFHMPSFAAL